MTKDITDLKHPTIYRLESAGRFLQKFAPAAAVLGGAGAVLGGLIGAALGEDVADVDSEMLDSDELHADAPDIEDLGTEGDFEVLDVASLEADSLEMAEPDSEFTEEDNTRNEEYLAPVGAVMGGVAGLGLAGLRGAVHAGNTSRFRRARWEK